MSAVPRLPERVSLPLLDAGVFVTAGVATVITVFFAIGIVLNAMLGVLRGEDYGPQDLIGGQSGGIAVVLGVLAAAAGLGARSLVLTRRANAFTGGHRVAGAVAVGTLCSPHWPSRAGPPGCRSRASPSPWESPWRRR
ncbi:MAG: hypothetical protein R2717_09430 [Schumannella sp.]